MSETITSVPLARPPRKANEFHSDGNLLAAWQLNDRVSGEDGVEYHFALHLPVLGWRAYRWDEQYGAPMMIFPASSRIVWVCTATNKFMRLKIAHNGDADITAAAKIDWLFDAKENYCLVGTEKSKIRRLHFDWDGQLLSNDDFDNVTADDWAYFLPDGAIVVLDYDKLVVLSPAGEIVYRDKPQNGRYHLSWPFILYREKDCLYYTNDPRQRWHRTSVPSLHKERTGNYGAERFIDVIGDACYIAVGHDENCVALYRSLSKATEHIEYVWGIKLKTHRYNLVCHNGLICISAQSPISGVGDVSIPENDGFLVWNPIENTFYVDIPRLTSIPRISATRTPVIHIPELWGWRYHRTDRYKATQ